MLELFREKASFCIKLICLCALILSAAPIPAAGGTASAAAVKTAQTGAEKTKRTGWVKIGKKTCYYNKKGVRLKNVIAGTKKSGYAYVDKNGIRVSDKRIKAAVRFVVKHTKLRGSRYAQLRKCYRALCTYSYYSVNHTPASAGKIRTYAAYMFRTHMGDCCNYAASMAYIARVLGYPARVAYGGVTAHADWPLSDHSITYVKDDRTWKIIDCSMGRAHTDENCFMVKRSEYPFRLRVDTVYRMIIKNGTVKWKKKAG